MKERYPLPRPKPFAEDGRFTIGLVYDVAAVLEKHGYPDAASLRLLTYLYRFLFEGEKGGVL